MANLSKTTKDHEEIRRWAEERGGKPSHVKSTSSEDEIGILRIDFPGFSGEGSLEEISWDDFFEKFDDQKLALVYQEETADGERSNFNKLVSGDSVETDEDEAESRPVKNTGRKAANKRAASKKTASKSSGRGTVPAKSSTKSPAKAVKKTGTVPPKKASKTPAKKTLPPAKKKGGPAKKSAPAKKVPAKKAAAKKLPAKKVPAKKTALRLKKESRDQKGSSKNTGGRRR